ncbi:MAG: amidohydrolase family protein [Bacteroidia bacterium]|nr:amidohydrolase family protein [Bacteroidia bacterium]MCX7763380.1 amidohydrolase family protein [Bacteroidia bacterium]MDW8056841.1 amidohydrolase family protein [Bacteroidia bacterium]
MNWIIREVRILTPSGEIEGDAWIREGRWAAVGQVPDSARGLTIEGKGRYLLPGLIDTHVHFRDLGLSHKGTFYTESRAAVAGGVTTAFDMPNTSPPTTTLRRWEEKMHYVSQRSWTNYALYFGATEHNLPEIRLLDPHRVPGVKVFLASSTGDLLVTDEAYVRQLMKESPVRLVFHSEKESLIRAAHAQWAEVEWETMPDLHTRLRPPEACIESTRWLLREATDSSVPVHILHITTGEEVQLLRHRPASVSAETCPIYLQWSSEDFSTYKHLLKCNPALKSSADREMLWQGLIEGTLEVVGTDHAPHLWTEKMRPYPEAPSGAPAHGYLLPWLWTMGRARGLSLSFWVEKMVYAPVRIWRIKERGAIQEGNWADGVLFAPEEETPVPAPLAPQHYSRVAWSPLSGFTLQGRVKAVWVNGQLSFYNGYFHGAPAGQPVVFG